MTLGCIEKTKVSTNIFFTPSIQFRSSSIEFVLNWGHISLRSFSIEIGFHWESLLQRSSSIKVVLNKGHLKIVWLSFCQVVFLYSDQTWDYHPEVYFNSGRLPLRLFCIEVDFHWGHFPFRLSSIEQVFYSDHLLFRRSSVNGISKSSSI